MCQPKERHRESARLNRHREGAKRLWRSTCRVPLSAKAHVDCRVETKVSPRNDNLEACHVMLVATVGALACGDSAYIFFHPREGHSPPFVSLANF